MTLAPLTSVSIGSALIQSATHSLPQRTHSQVTATTDFVQAKVIEPAREVAALMAGFRRGLEVLVAPMPEPINQTYAEDEMFIG